MNPQPFIRLPRRGKPGTVPIRRDTLEINVRSHETPLTYYLVGTDILGKEHRVGGWERNRAGEQVPVTGWDSHEKAAAALAALRWDDREGAA